LKVKMYNKKIQKIICKRALDGTPEVNIKQEIVCHSPTGFEWGYGGSGPADLALNILYYVTRDKDLEGATK